MTKNLFLTELYDLQFRIGFSSTNIGKEEGDDRKSVLNWALKFWNGETICAVHVHVPTQKTRQQTRYGFRSPLKTVRGVEVNQELERLKVEEMLDDSLNMFALKQVPAEKIIIEKESVTDGILELISQLGIQKLVMGAGANSRFLRIKPKPTSEKSNEVLNKAPDFCHIWFVYKSRLIYTREAMRQLNQHLVENQLNRLSYLEQSIDLPSAESSPLSQNMHHDSSPATVLQNIIDNDSYDQLQQPLAQAEKVRQEEACEDSEGRQKAESEAMKAIHSLKASDEKLNKMKGKINDLQLKVHKGLKVLYQAAAAGEFLSIEIEDEDEEEEKMLFTEYLQKNKKQCDKVIMDFDDTLDVYLSADDDSAEVVQVLEEQVSQEPSSSNVPMFSCEFSQLDIREATMFFDPSLIIHEGDNGILYKGCLHNTEVAIKVLKPDSLQGNAEFKHEVDVLSKLRHPNLVSLIGPCHDSLALIYQYLPNGNLEDRLNCKDNTPPLPWQTRIQIVIELCSALNFLHSIQPCSIIHSDLKPKNILLDANFSCKLSGFSFCHIIPNNKQTLTIDELMGTSSYIDLDSLDDGLLSLKSDVYSFGIILLRLLTGRPALNIVKEVQHALENDYLHSILDPAAGDWPVVRAQQLAHMALKSCDIKAKDHPNLGSEIWRVLNPVITSTESFSSPLQPVSGDQIPSYFICPIFQDIMRDPHFAADGFTYEADAVRGWFESGSNTSPMTNLKLSNHNLTPNRALRSAIQEWLLQHHLV
ncbi:U-box domain-containing protein 33-like isoform X2 [Chenopodium quinoa]|uniref:U-box domain-containing protein 33-like isoform X2 n=1 Tax=Chenopodium quinoa TaxID=63459 RepID=UPI000B78E920|nr:U-box domain-containing protein 33-like isoform X2 [Chenopodium quinoa]